MQDERPKILADEKRALFLKGDSTNFQVKIARRKVNKTVA
jgi:hypothetical protein